MSNAERLTKRDGKGRAYFDDDGALIRGANGAFHQKKDMTGQFIHQRFVALDKAIDRLAAYEDTGLEPEEIKEVQEAMEPIPFGRFRDIMEAERTGRLVLPSEPNTPLTLEELLEMDGMPVWVCEPNGANGVWGLVDLEYQMIRLHGGGLAIWENNDKSWLAYRRKPEEGTA